MFLWLIRAFLFFSRMGLSVSMLSSNQSLLGSFFVPKVSLACLYTVSCIVDHFSSAFPSTNDGRASCTYLLNSFASFGFAALDELILRFPGGLALRSFLGCNLIELPTNEYHNQHYGMFLFSRHVEHLHFLQLLGPAGANVWIWGVSRKLDGRASFGTWCWLCIDCGMCTILPSSVHCRSSGQCRSFQGKYSKNPCLLQLLR